MNTITVYLGGLNHLNFMQYSPSKFSIMNGGHYQLCDVPELGNRFYLHKDLDPSQPEVGKESLQHHLRSVYSDFYPAGLLNRYAYWTYNVLRFRLSSKAWIYIDTRDFFADMSKFSLSHSQFKYALLQYVFTKMPESVRRITLLMLAQKFPNAFFVPHPSNTSDVNKRLVKQVRPFDYDIYKVLFDSLQPKNTVEMELLTLTLAYYCNSNSYLLSVANGKSRINLDGVICSIPTLHERQHALNVLLGRSYKVPPDLVAKVHRLNAVPTTSEFNSLQTA